MSDAARAATEAAFAEHDGGDVAPETETERYPQSDLDNIVDAAYVDAEARATVDEYRENYHTADAAEKREAERAEMRGETNLGDFQDLADKYGPYLKERGFTLKESVERLIATDHAIGSAGPEARDAMIAQLAQSYGSDPAVLATMTPEAAHYAVQAHSMELQEAHQQADVVSAQARVDTFATAKHEDGSLVNPFFREVEQKMARIAQADIALGGSVPNIETLYKRAISGDQRIAYRMQAIEAEQKAMKAEGAARLKRAKAAGSSVSGSGGEPGPAAIQNKTTLEDLVATAMAQHGA